MDVTLHRLGLVWRSLREFLVHDVLTAFAALVAAVIIWYLVTLGVTAQWLPKPSGVASRIGDLFGQADFRSAFLSSVITLAVGFIIAAIAGAITGLAMALMRLVNYALRYYVDAILIVPSIALAPIFIIVFGITSQNVLALTVLYAYGIIALSTNVAVGGVDPTTLEVGRVFGADGRRLIFRIILPAAMPAFFGGLHLGMTRAFKGLVVGQVFLGVLGIGGYVARFSQAFDDTGIWSIALILIVMALIVTWIVKAVDHVVNYWAYRA